MHQIPDPLFWVSEPRKRKGKKYVEKERMSLNLEVNHAVFHFSQPSFIRGPTLLVFLPLHSFLFLFSLQLNPALLLGQNYIFLSFPFSRSLQQFNQDRYPSSFHQRRSEESNLQQLNFQATATFIPSRIIAVYSLNLLQV